MTEDNKNAEKQCDIHVVMCSAEKELTKIEREEAWQLLYDCLDYGSEEARPVMFDQSKLIVLVNKLLNKK